MELVKQSYGHNKDHDISGLLLYRVSGEASDQAGRYMQLLEGSEEEVKRLYSKIQLDKRHTKITLVNEGYLKRKHFKDWSMAFKKITHETINQPGYISIDEAFVKQLTSKKFNIALVFLRTFYGLPTG